jgi:hypothetical protein
VVPRRSEAANRRSLLAPPPDAGGRADASTPRRRGKRCVLLLPAACDLLGRLRMRTTLVMVLVTTALAGPTDAASYRRTITVSDATPAPESGFGGPLAATPSGALVIGSGFVNGNGSAQLFDAGTGGFLRAFASPHADPPGSSTFGASVAAVGDDVLVGEPGFPVGDTSAGGAFVGAVHRFDGPTGSLEHTFLSPSPTPDARFGRRIAVHGTDLFVVEGARLVHRFDLGSNAFLASFAPPPGSDPFAFGDALLALDGLVVVGDPGANRVVVFDVGTGAVVRTIFHPVAGEAARFGHSLALMDGDLLVGAPAAADGGAVYRIAIATGWVRTRFASPAPAGS